MKILISIVAAILLAHAANAQSLPLVPYPANVEIEAGYCELPRVISVSVPSKLNDWDSHIRVFNSVMQRSTEGKHQAVFLPGDRSMLKFERSENLKEEAYSIQITPQEICVAASGLKGLCRATATLLQLIGGYPDGKLPLLKISDQPAVPYRNFMVDMGRNPHSLELLKETIDLLWFYKVDSIQLHLTDDQRFAFPSTAFPKLWDGKITIDEFKALEAYARVRGVTIIPELEVPGHSGILRSKYPEVFGKTEADLANSDKALIGIKTLLDEILDVFPSTPYVHIGGDEASGVPEEDQRDLINTLHAYLKSKGKQTLVWEGPRPGKGKNKVNEEVIHLNWRTINYPADRMLDDGYRVVNAAWDPLYLVDHYPRTNFTMTSPQHIYETLKLTRFKHVNPGIPTYQKPLEVEPNDRLIGFCMPWWEGREVNYFPQVVPRVIPFAEVAWNPTEERDYEAFQKRVQKTEAARMKAFYPVSIEASDLAIESDGVFHNEVVVDLATPQTEGSIRFTTDGSQPNAPNAANAIKATSQNWKSSLKLTQSTTVRAALFKDGNQIGHGSRRTFTAVQPVKNLALGKPVRSSAPSGSPFSVERITDGSTENLDFYLGYPAEPKPIEITIDLEQPKSIERIVVVAYTISHSFEKYSVEVSADGKAFEEVASRLEKPAKPIGTVEHQFPKRDVRFVRIKSFGNKGYVFDSFSKIVEVQVFE